MPPRRHRHLPGVIIAIAVAVVVGLAGAPRRSVAVIPVSTVLDVPRTIFQAIDNIRQKLATVIKGVGDVAFKSSIDLFERRLIDSLQTDLATVAPGQKPLFLTNPKTFFKKVADASAGDYIDNFSRGVTGETGPGLPTSGARGVFLISRLLRKQANSVVNGVTGECQQQCQVDFSTDNLDLTSLVALSDTVFKRDWPENAFRNKHEWNKVVISRDIKATQALIDQGDTLGACPDVQMNVSGSVTTWVVSVGQVVAGPMLRSDCLLHQTEALNIEGSLAQAETNQCLQSCQARGSAATNAVNGLTATNVFSAVQNANPRNAPAALANALSNDKSDLGQFLTAAGALTATVQQDVLGEQTNLQPNILPVTTRVSGEVTTPSPVASALLGVPFVGSNGQFTYTGTSVADILKGIASFINSPVGKALATYFNSKCGLNPSLCKGPSNARSTIGQLVFGSGGPTGVAGAQLLYATLGQAQIISGTPGRNDISIADQLTANGLIDAGFRQAIEETVTVQEALDRHYLDPQKTFGYDKNGVEPNSGYPFRALQYLRKYRVIPVGWELAAKYSQLFDHRDLSLGYLTQRFQTCGQDSTHKVCSRGDSADRSCQTDAECGIDQNGSTITCGASPYCGLIDPNWVLKAPQTFCRRQGAGEEIISKEFVCDTNNIDANSGNVIPAGVTCSDTSDICTDTAAPNCVQSASNTHPDIGRWVIERNTDTCADSQSCIAENEDGSCQAYGYCVQERQQFKFDGTQCNAQNGTCTSYANSLGQTVAYLANTLDSRNCTADNAGCTQYCREPSFDPNTQTCTDTGTGIQTINLTAKAQKCDQTQVGCHQYMQTTNGTNLLANGGFETVDQPVDGPNPTSLLGWVGLNGLLAYPVSATDPAVTGNNKVAWRLTGAAGSILQQTVNTGHDLYERTFTLSVRAKAANTCSATLQLAPIPNPANGPRVPANAAATNINVTTDWQTYQATLTVPPAGTLVLSTFNLAAGLRLDGCSSTLVIDSAQLEEAFSASGYKDYGLINAIYLNGNRLSCQPADVGCQTYVPVAGGSNVIGQVLNSNRCTADKVGCGSYNLEPITSVPTRTGGQTNIVAPKGQACSAVDVGCEEYTNLDEVAKGGEGKEYFKSVKQCVKPSQTNAANPIAATYYTWVGDAKLGYVLRSYDLVQSNLSGAPCTNLSVGSVGTPPTCNDTAASVTSAQLNCTSGANLATNPECAEYYDSALRVYYRLRARTVSITDDCHPYRNTIDQSLPNPAPNNIYYLSTSENLTCAPAAAGCRAYTGNASGTTRQVVNDTFEINGTANWVGGTATNDSVNLNGHSMLVSVGTTAVTKLPANQFFAGRTYLVSFSMAPVPAAGAPSPLPTVRAAIGTYAAGNFTSVSALPGTATGSWNPNITPPGPEWKQFTLGPVTLAADIPTGQLGLTVGGGGNVDIDNVVLTEINDHLYLISSSVPQCLPSEVGCAAYRDSKGSTNYLTSFNRLCSEQVAGCEALIDTQNSSTPFAVTTAITPPVTTPADTVVTMVNNPANYCPAAAKGCEVMGQPVYGPDQKLTTYLSQYLINDPDRYNLDLCSDNELSCQVYTTADGSAVYFKDPGQRVCDFRPGSDGTGRWYITGTTQLCPSVTPPAATRPIGPSCSPVCVGGDRAGQACTMLPASANECPGGGTCQGDMGHVGQIYDVTSAKFSYGSCTINRTNPLLPIDNCRVNQTGPNENTCIYLAGSCPAEQNGCTEYRDPTDPAGCRSECPLSLAQGGTADYLDAACARTQCADGARAGQNCATDTDCQDAIGPHACVGGDGQPAVGLPGCRSYFYLRQSIETNAGVCNGKVNTAIGCRPFNDTSIPGLNYRGQ